MTISIITVTFNAAATLQRTLASVERQRYAHIEHVIMDGASTDGTVAMAEEYRERTAYSVTVVSERDGGLYDAMNKAMALATGEYVVFLNAGDALHDADTLARVAEAAQGKAIRPGVVYGDTAIVDSEGRMLHLRRLRPPHDLNWRSFRHGMTVCHQSFYVNRHLVQEYDLRYRFSADVDWCIRCMKEGESRGLANVMVTDGEGQPAVLADYLAEGMTTANHRASLIERMRIMTKHYGWPTTVAMHVWFAIRNVIKLCF